MKDNEAIEKDLRGQIFKAVETYVSFRIAEFYLEGRDESKSETNKEVDDGQGK